MITVVLLLFLLVKSIGASNVPPEVEQAIAQALQGKWAFGNFDKTKLSMGFDSATMLKDITAGEPFQLYSISRMDLEAAREDTPVDTLIRTHGWFVPLYVADTLLHPVMILNERVAGKDKKWSAGVHTRSNLVATWLRIKDAWPERLGYHPKLITISEPTEHNVCFYIPEMGPRNLTVIGKLYRGVFPQPDTMGLKVLTSSDKVFHSIKMRISEQQKKSDSLWAEKRKINDSLADLRERATEILWKKYEVKEKAAPGTAVLSLWHNRPVVADEAIIPENMSKAELAARRPEQFDTISRRLCRPEGNGVTIDSTIMKNAQPLRIGAQPVDRSIAKGEDHWYVLFADDGPGFIRIGTTGPLLLVQAPYKDGQPWGAGGSVASYGAPENGTELVEISGLSPTNLALRWRVEKAFLKIHAENSTPLQYRISFVGELPDTRIGGAYGPGVVSERYIMAVAYGDTVDVYRTTRHRFSAKQVSALRKRLFGTEAAVRISSEYRRPDALEANAEGKLHVQHPIVCSYTPDGVRRGWAFEIVCMQRDGLWLVADAYRDPGLSDMQIKEIIDRVFEKMH